MKNQRRIHRIGFLLAFGILGLGIADSQKVLGQGPPGGNEIPNTVLGESIPGLPLANLTAFDEGKVAFRTEEDVADGIGPVFNGTSCASCHAAGAIGGAAPNNTFARVTRIGGLKAGVYTDLPEKGGPVIQARSLQDFIAGYPIPPEVVPTEAKFVSHRMTTPLFGAGLIEAIPAQTLVENSKRSLRDGVKGQLNWVTNVETGKKEIGRFGWKAQISGLREFSGDAYLNEMGITNVIFPHENLPQGNQIPAGADNVEDPEDHDNDVQGFVDYMRFLAPPSNVASRSPQFERGRNLFSSTGCNQCHQPVMQTGPSKISAISRKNVWLYSDLLLHRMGASLADGIQQGTAKGDQFRTAPLWGVGSRPFLLHDGRATTIPDAVREHGGEATKAAQRFFNLRPGDRNTLIDYVRRL